MNPHPYNDESSWVVRLISLVAAIGLLLGVGWLLISNVRPKTKPVKELQLVSFSVEEEPAQGEMNPQSAAQPAEQTPTEDAPPEDSEPDTETPPPDPETKPQEEPETASDESSDQIIQKPKEQPKPVEKPKPKPKPVEKPKPKPKPKPQPKPKPVQKPKPQAQPAPQPAPAPQQPAFSGPAQFSGELKPQGAPVGQAKKPAAANRGPIQLTDARVIKAPDPIKIDSRTARSVGHVRMSVSAVLDPSGKLTNIRLNPPSSSQKLNRAIIKSIQTGRYKPQLENGTPVSQPVKWTLDQSF